MKRWKVFVTALCLPLALAALPGTAKAGEATQSTMFTFSEPVEIPGKVLAPGSYLFRLKNDPGNRNIVEIFNKKRTRLYATLLAIPDYRTRVTGKPVIKLRERAEDAPEAIHAWFYPGSHYGHEFVYPSVPPVEMAQANDPKASAEAARLATDVAKAAKSAAGRVASDTRDALHFLAKQLA
jgi:hypothetical protein